MQTKDNLSTLNLQGLNSIPLNDYEILVLGEQAPYSYEYLSKNFIISVK